MEVVRENKDKLNAEIKISIKEEDYAAKVDAALKKYRKQAKVPGFRSGMVPMGMIKKMVGSNILADEINHILSHALQDYISENKLDILGNPLPVEDDKNIDWEQQKDFDFKFELGLAPEVNVSLSEKDKFERYKVKISDKLVKEQVEEIAKRYGKMISVDSSQEGDMLYGNFEEMDGKKVKEDGISHQSTLNISILDKKDQKKFIGMKAGDTLVFNPKKLADDHYVAAWLGIDKADVSGLKSDFRFTLEKINRMEPAELNQDFFDKMYGKDQIKSLDELKSKIREEMEKGLDNNADALFEREIQDFLIKKAKLSLPDDFMKKWLMQANEKPVSKEQIESEYDQYALGLKWQLIENKLIKDNDIKVSREELIEHVKGLLNKQLSSMGQNFMEDAELEDTANRILENQEEAQKIYEQLYQEKLKQYYKDTVKLKEKEIDYDDFVKLANKKRQ